MSDRCKFKQYVWELPLRWFHWINVLAIVILSGTGYLIGHPVTLGASASDYAMGWIRFVHFVAAYAFTVSVASRVVWAFIGNEHASWRAFFPMYTAAGREKLRHMIRYYTLQTHEVPEIVGHNPLATTAYFVLFLIYLGMILTGFAMYATHAPGGVMFKSLGFMYSHFTLQGMRLAHHFGMWLIFGFVINHIYSAWLMDIKEHGGEISSMFSGYKFTVKKGD
ncbi:Ni/Fe-hydrogenase, b-type cytochrome subunit [Geomonas oryzisoli]|uniref:Ni/Fe-hydrogenase, b-type cytochrome subunit n=1 Tax=Geomonas oryzisoli TaxID=2847992 RepID=A0ABX8J5T7_9BACT|nr:Ni/Fe-hydrogenase, b-type cytochrome subunit [Geomonas oryzisoli]QWV93799.1 Ni/Fe-hydrogenase, b-type cytochrome subunit [Geomonas oryzisoli]